MILQVTDAGKWAQVPCHKSFGPLNLNCACSHLCVDGMNAKRVCCLYHSILFILFVRRKCEAKVGGKSQIVP